MACTPAVTTTLDFSKDYLVWDNYLTVVHTSVRNGTNVEQCIERAHRHNIDDREPAPSFGTYGAFDVVIRLPVPGGTVIPPKPRDTIRDSTGTVYTILSVTYAAMLSRYRCVCRDLVLANDLLDLIDIQRATITLDAAGVPVKSWGVLFGAEPARVQPITADIAEERGIRGLRITHEVFVSRELAVTNEDRISFGGKYYEIRGYKNSERIDELAVISAELMP